MLVKMRFNDLIFVGLSEEEVEHVTYHADKCTMVLDQNGSVQVRGSQADLYILLYNLSVTYDLEIM